MLCRARLGHRETDPDPVRRPPLCGDWDALKKALRENRRVAFVVSKTDMHVWTTDTPNPADHCQCGALTW
jgi:hypothetical protein